MNSRVHPKYKTKYSVGNWRKYERALVRRGDVTIWLSADAIDAWKPARFWRRGAQRKFSDHAIETGLTLRLVFRLPLNNLGLRYGAGLGVPQDDAEAVRWWRLAADQGHVDAQNSLGFMYREGRGVPQDAAEAVRWYRLAADQGHAGAQYTLGVSYAQGRGVPQDYEEAVRWYRLAAAQGDATAQFNLGVRYAEGRGVVQDYVQAHKWTNLAASRQTGEERKMSADARDALAGLMTPAQLAEALRLARAWDAASPREP